MDTGTEGWPSRPMTVDEVWNLTRSGELEYVTPLFGLSEDTRSVIVFYGQRGRSGDYYGYDPVESWEVIAVADTAEDVRVHARAQTYLRHWLSTNYPDRYALLDHDGTPLQ